MLQCMMLPRSYLSLLSQKLTQRTHRGAWLSRHFLSPENRAHHHRQIHPIPDQISRGRRNKQVTLTPWELACHDYFCTSSSSNQQKAQQEKARSKNFYKSQQPLSHVTETGEKKGGKENLIWSHWYTTTTSYSSGHYSANNNNHSPFLVLQPVLL